MKYQQIVNEIIKGEYKPIYFLQGEEAFYIDKISSLISERILTEDEKAFNQLIVYGKDKDISVENIINNVKQYPMMASHRVVIVKEAQHLIKSIDKLISYVESPLESSILVMCYKYKNLDGRKPLAKLLKKKKFIYTSDKIKDYNLIDWIIQYFTSQNLKIHNKAAMLLSELIGNDLSAISSIAEKLKVSFGSKKVIDEKAISDNVGVSKDYNIFELQNAIGTKNVYKANLITNHFGNNPNSHPLVVTISSLFSYFTKLMKYHFYYSSMNEKLLASKMGVHPYFLKQYKLSCSNYSKNKLVRIFGYLRQYDMMSKGVNNSSTSDAELLKELIFKIMH
jgi:DNA polymerase III subunit delta